MSSLRGVNRVGKRRCEHLGRVVHRQRRLRHDADTLGIPDFELFDVRDILDETDAPAERCVELAHRALDLRVALVADQDHVAAFTGVARDFHVHLGHQRAGRVEHPQATAPRLDLHGLRDSVRAEDHRGVGGHLVELVDEHRPEAAQPVDHELVVHDLVAYVDRRAEKLDGSLDDVDGPIHAGTEAAGIGEQDLHGWRFSRNASTINSAAPTVIALSATLKAGKYAAPQWAWMKSIT
jgi:hypothetical protein